jgi:hypothetical protein
MNCEQRKSLIAIYPNSLKSELVMSEIRVVYYIGSKVLTATIFILRHKTHIVTSFRYTFLFKIWKFMIMVH